MKKLLSILLIFVSLNSFADDPYWWKVFEGISINGLVYRNNGVNDTIDLAELMHTQAVVDSLVNEADTLKSSILQNNNMPYYSGGLQNSGVYWDAVNGRMGVGTVSPSAKLDIQGGDLYLDRGYSFYFNAVGSGARSRIYSNNGNDVNIQTAGTLQAFSVLNGGNVGIGTATPSFKSTVYSATGNYFASALQSGAIGTPGNWIGQLYGYGASAGYNKGATIFESIDGNGRGKFHIALNNALNSSDVTLADAKLTILPDGNVGIGTTNPTAPFTIYKDGDPNIGSFLLDQPTVPTGTTSRGPHFFFKSGGINRGWFGFFDNAAHGSGTALNLRSAGDVRIGASVGSAPDMIIKVGGNVGIGTITPTEKLDVNGQSKFLQISAALTDGAPTDAEIDTAIGKTPATAGAGYQATIKDNNGTGLLYKIESDGTSWFYLVMTKAL